MLTISSFGLIVPFPCGWPPNREAMCSISRSCHSRQKVNTVLLFTVLREIVFKWKMSVSMFCFWYLEQIKLCIVISYFVFSGQFYCNTSPGILVFLELNWLWHNSHSDRLDYWDYNVFAVHHPSHTELYLFFTMVHSEVIDCQCCASKNNLTTYTSLHRLHSSLAHVTREPENECTGLEGYTRTSQS